MIVVIIAIVAVLALIFWNFTIEDSSLKDIKIPESSNIVYRKLNPLIPEELASKIENEKGRPILLFVYTTWCGVCKKQLPEINEIAREFQNANVTFIAVAIDKNLTENEFSDYISIYGDIYFKPYYLTYSNGISEVLRQKGTKYRGTIPFTAIIDSEGRVIENFNGIKKPSYIRKKLIRAIYN